MREDWIEVELGSVCQKAQKVKRKEMPLKRKLKYLDIGGVDNISNRIVSHKEFTWQDAPSRAQQIVKKGDILFSTVRTYLKNIAQVTRDEYENEICSSGFTVLRGTSNVVHPNFIFHLTLSTGFLNSLSELQTGTSYPAVRDKDVFAQKINLPPLPEQRAIVAKIEELFSDLDKGIADLKKAQDQLKVYRQAVLKKAFEGEYSEGVIIELNRIGEHCKIVSGKAFKKSEYSDSGVRLFQIANVSFNKIVWDKIAHLPKSYLSDEKLKDLVLKEGDLVMALNRPMLNNQLKIGILGKSDVPSILYQRVGKFIFDSSINSKYLGYFFQSPLFIRWLSKELQGVNIPFINQSNLLGFSEFPYVDIELQHQIVREIESRLSVCDKVEQSITESLEKARALRQSILKKAFEGTLLSQEEIAACKAAPDYEPAGVLLARIERSRNERIKGETLRQAQGKKSKTKTVKKVNVNG